MNLFALSGLSVGISCIFLSLITLFFGKEKIHRLLLFFNLVVAVWGFGLFLVGIANYEVDAVFGWKIAHLGGFFVGPAFYHLVSVLTSIQRRKIISFAYAQAILFALIGYSTELILNKTRFVYDLYYLEINPLYFMGFIFYMLFVILSFYELLKFLPKTKGYQHTQILYIIVGFMFGFVGATTAFLPMFKIDILYPFGNFGITLYVFIVTYAILRHRLMDIQLIFKRTMVYSLSAGLLTAFFIVLVLVLTRYLSDFFGMTSFAITVISALVIALLFHPLKGWIQFLIDKVFYKKTYDYYSEIQNASNKLASTINLDHIYRFVVSTFFDTLKLKNAYFLSKKNDYLEVVYSRLLKYEPNDENIIHAKRISSDSELVKQLDDSRGTIAKQDMYRVLSQDSADAISEEIKPFYGEVAVPIFIDNTLTYLLILGEKLSGDFFSEEDINLISSIVNQASMSLKNAKLYEELDIKVEQRTDALALYNEQLKNEIAERIQAEEALRSSEKRFKQVAESAGEWIWEVDKDGLYTYASPVVEKILGYKPEEIVNKKTFYEFFPSDVREDFKKAAFEVFARKEAFADFVNPNVHKNGNEVILETSGVPILDKGGNLLGYRGTDSDITHRKKAEDELISAKARLQHLLISSPAVIYSRRTDAGLNFTFVSDNVEKQFGYKPEEFIGNPHFWFSQIYSDDVMGTSAGLSSLINRGHHINEYKFKHKDGYYLWVRDEMQLICDEQKNPVEIVGYWIEITERKQAEEQLSHRAFFDQLTGLPNRSLFMDRLNIAFEYKKRYKEYLFAVVFMDVDRFKIINDSLGHLAGDEMLIMISRRLQECVRSVDTVARFGGDEFAILLEDLQNAADVNIVAERVSQAMKAPFNLYGHELFTSLSQGIVLCEVLDYVRPEELLRDADIAMYFAKERGRACHVVFEKSMQIRATEVFKLETDLRKALKRGEFRIYYQPIMVIDNNNIAGFEALIRWHHSERGLLLPADFIEVAEETELMIPIGQWVLREACRQMREWQNKFPAFSHLFISVNLSSKEFSQPQFVNNVTEILYETGLNPNSLRLEITERMIMENPESASNVLGKLRDLDIRFDIDDFGTGHSALSYLRHLPIDGLKIDRSFINTLAVDKDNTEIVKTIVALAHNLRINIVAEGVEKAEQLALLKEMKGEYAQGYLFHKPMDSNAAEALLEEK